MALSEGKADTLKVRRYKTEHNISKKKRLPTEKEIRNRKEEENRRRKAQKVKRTQGLTIDALEGVGSAIPAAGAARSLTPLIRLANIALRAYSNPTSRELVKIVKNKGQRPDKVGYGLSRKTKRLTPKPITDEEKQQLESIALSVRMLRRMNELRNQERERLRNFPSQERILQEGKDSLRADRLSDIKEGFYRKFGQEWMSPNEANFSGPIDKVQVPSRVDIEIMKNTRDPLKDIEDLYDMTMQRPNSAMVSRQQQMAIDLLKARLREQGVIKPWLQ